MFELHLSKYHTIIIQMLVFVSCNRFNLHQQTTLIVFTSKKKKGFSLQIFTGSIYFNNEKLIITATLVFIIMIAFHGYKVQSTILHSLEIFKYKYAISLVFFFSV